MPGLSIKESGQNLLKQSKEEQASTEEVLNKRQNDWHFVEQLNVRCGI